MGNKSQDGIWRIKNGTQSLCWSCSMCQVVQHGGILAEWAFGAHMVNQEVKNVAMSTKDKKT